MNQAGFNKALRDKFLRKKLDKLKKNMKFCKKCGEHINDGECSNHGCPTEIRDEEY